MDDTLTTDALTFSGFLHHLEQLNKIPPRRLGTLNCLPELLRAEQMLRAIRKDMEERL